MDTFQLSSTLNLNKICRICLLEFENMFSVYSAFFEENESENIPRIHEILKQISSIEIVPADNLPKLICSKCKDKAHISYQFQLQCIRSQSFLNDHIAQLSKYTSGEITENFVQDCSPYETKEINKEQLLKSNENERCNKIFKETKISKTVGEINIKPIGIESNNYGHNWENSFNRNRGTSFESSVIKNCNVQDNFNDDFNSESDESLTGEDILSTEDILKSLDLISNIGNQEDLGEDEDCDDLKSCILLGDETVDQLIKDNLQVDNLDSLPPKMESFNLAETDTNSTNNTSSKHQIDKACFLQEATSTVNPSEPEKVERYTKHCESYFKQIDKQTISTPTCIDTVQSDKLQQPVCKPNIAPIPQKTTTKLTLLKNPQNATLKTFKYTDKCNLKSSSLNEYKFSSKNASNKLVGFEHQVSTTNIVNLHDNLINKSSGKNMDFQKHVEQVLCADLPNKPKSDYKLKLILLQNPINKPKIKPNLILKLPDKSENEASFKRCDTEIAHNSNSTTFSSNRTNLQKSGPALVKIKSNEAIVVKSPNDKMKDELSNNNNNKLKVGILENLTKKFNVGQGLLPFTDKNHTISTNKLNEEVSYSIPTEEIKPGLTSFKFCNVEQRKIKVDPEQINLLSNPSFKIKIENTSVEDTFKKSNSSNQLLNESQAHSVPFKTESNELKVEFTPFKYPTLQNIPFKHPNIITFKSKYQAKNNIIKKPGELCSMQISGKTPTHFLQSFPKIKTFSIKPREPPNMDYYKQEGENNTVEYACNICPKKFRFAHNLRFHIKNHGLEKPFICTECKKDFKVYGSLVHHSRSHSGEQPYECQICGKRYKQSGTLTAHMRVHTGQKPFKCKVCGKGFRQAPDLTYHMRTHTKEKPYMCTVCGKTMSMQCHLVQHMRSHTGEKPYKCLDCGKAFPSSTRLKRHTIIHTSLKPFKCKICTKAFNRNSSLQVHMKVHTGRKSHICPYCNRSFFWAHSLRTHIATSHLKENEKDKVASSSGAIQEENYKCDSTIKTEPLSDKTATEDYSFTILTPEDINKLGLESYQIFTIGCSNQDIKTFTVYDSDCNNDHLTNPLSAVSI